VVVAKKKTVKKEERNKAYVPRAFSEDKYQVGFIVFFFNIYFYFGLISIRMFVCFYLQLLYAYMYEFATYALMQVCVLACLCTAPHTHAHARTPDTSAF
jgi:hypothetical protein